MNLSKYGPGDEITWGSYTGHPLDPRNCSDDDEELNIDDARDEAREEFCSNARLITEFINQNVPANSAAVNTYKVGEDLSEVGIDTLVALIFNGNWDQCRAARTEFRHRYLTEADDDLEARAEDILAGWSR